MRPNPQFPADLVAFTEEILNGKLQFFFAVNYTENVKNFTYVGNIKKSLFQRPGVKAKAINFSDVCMVLKKKKIDTMYCITNCM